MKTSFATLTLTSALAILSGCQADPYPTRSPEITARLPLDPDARAITDPLDSIDSNLQDIKDELDRQRLHRFLGMPW